MVLVYCIILGGFHRPLRVMKRKIIKIVALWRAHLQKHRFCNIIGFHDVVPVIVLKFRNRQIESVSYLRNQVITLSINSFESILMIVVLYFFITLHWVMYIYIPIICFAGSTVSITVKYSTNLIYNPYLGIIKVSNNKAIIIWSTRFILLGVIISDYYKWYHDGINPFIPL